LPAGSSTPPITLPQVFLLVAIVSIGANTSGVLRFLVGINLVEGSTHRRTAISEGARQLGNPTRFRGYGLAALL